MFMWVIIQPHIYAETVSRVHTLHTMHNKVCVCVCVCVSISVCVCVSKQKTPIGMQGQSTMYVKK